MNQKTTTAPTDEPEVKAAKRRKALDEIRATMEAEGKPQWLIDDVIQSTRNAFLLSDQMGTILDAVNEAFRP